VIFAEDITVLSNQYHMLVVNEWEHAHTFPAFDNTINGGSAIRHLGDILAQARPGILVNLSA
jgi:hypothetical protein